MWSAIAKIPAALHCGDVIKSEGGPAAAAVVVVELRLGQYTYLSSGGGGGVGGPRRSSRRRGCEQRHPPGAPARPNPTPAVMPRERQLEETAAQV